MCMCVCQGCQTGGLCSKLTHQEVSPYDGARGSTWAVTLEPGEGDTTAREAWAGSQVRPASLSWELWAPGSAVEEGLPHDVTAVCVGLVSHCCLSGHCELHPPWTPPEPHCDFEKGGKPEKTRKKSPTPEGESRGAHRVENSRCFF